MNSDKFQELGDLIQGRLMQQAGLHSEAAEFFAKDAVDQMVEKGSAIELSDDEERMLAAYRRFREKHASGIFSWVMEETPGLVLPETPSLIVDPRDVSVSQES